MRGFDEHPWGWATACVVVLSAVGGSFLMPVGFAPTLWLLYALIWIASFIALPILLPKPIPVLLVTILFWFVVMAHDFHLATKGGRSFGAAWGIWIARFPQVAGIIAVHLFVEGFVAVLSRRIRLRTSRRATARGFEVMQVSPRERIRRR
jgi:hypothetical protein